MKTFELLIKMLGMMICVGLGYILCCAVGVAAVTLLVIVFG